MFLKNITFNVIIAAILALAIIFLMPKDYFSKYKIEKTGENKFSANTRSYYQDLDNDDYPEAVVYYKIELGHSINILRNNALLDLYNLDTDELFVSKNLKFADNNKNGIKEIYFISELKAMAYLNILEYINSKNKFIIQKIPLDSINYYNKIPDVVNYNIDFTYDHTESEPFWELLRNYYPVSLQSFELISAWL